MSDNRRDVHRPARARRALRAAGRAKGARRRCLAAGLLVLLAGCAAPATAPGGLALTGSPQPGYTPLTLGPAKREAARRAARAAMRAYARPGRSPRAWWTGLSPYLSAPARAAYAGTDPAVIPARVVTGPAALTPASLPALARVAVPTDAGIYLVILSRSPGQPWAVERITAPEVAD